MLNLDKDASSISDREEMSDELIISVFQYFFQHEEIIVMSDIDM